MYIIIICATIPTLRQFYLRVIKGAVTGLSYGKSRDYITPSQPNGSIPLGSNPRKSTSQRQSLGLGMSNHTANIHESSSQENILPENDSTGIRKQTDVYIGYGSSDAGQKEENPHFPHANPFAPQWVGGWWSGFSTRSWLSFPWFYFGWHKRKGFGFLSV